MNANRNTLQWKPSEKSGMARDEIPVIATTIIRIGLTILASTAACPSTNAPTIPIVGPIGEGTRSPASRINSKESSIKKISNMIGKGTVSLDATIANSNSVGISSWWKFVIAIYKPGSKRVIIKAITRIILNKFANWYFMFWSSGEDMKSTKVPGAINEYGLPLTKITTLPSNKWLTALSGLSVDINCGRLHFPLSSINCSSCPRRNKVIYIYVV